MLSSVRSRLTAFVAATAVITGAGLAAALPATAAPGATITVAPESLVFTEWDWDQGKGITVEGSGFDADENVIVSLWMGQFAQATIDVVAEDDGTFTTSFVPSAGGPWVLPSGSEYTLKAEGETSGATESVPLTILRAAGVVSNAIDDTITTAQLINENSGINVLASGFEPGENVRVTATYLGDTSFDVILVADKAGSVRVAIYLASGTAEPGSVEFSFTGETSNHTESHSITVTGETIGGGVPDLGTTDPSGPAAAVPALPIVSG